MTRRGPAALLAVMATLAATISVSAPLSPAVAGASAVAGELADGSVSMALAGPLEPPSPDAKAPVSSITIPLTLTNTTDETLYDVGVSARRGAPVVTRSGLAEAFAGSAIPAGPTTNDVATRQTLAGPLPAHSSATLRYVTDSSTDGVCLCYLGVYPIDLLATAASSDGGDRVRAGRLQTYLPSVTEKQSEPVQVGWVWSLLERPHRESAGSAFVDDDLGGSIRPGGRLDRALATVEQLDAADPGGAIRLLLVLDPETIAELTTMTTGYSVRTAGGTAVGLAGPAAQAWLTRLAAVLTRHDVRFTAPADPDVEALTARGLAWGRTLDGIDSAAVAAALGRPVEQISTPGFAWPPGGTISSDGLHQLLTNRTTEFLAAAPTEATDGSLDDVATLSTDAGSGRVLLADSELDKRAVAALGPGGDTAAALQELLSTVAITAVQSPTQSRFVAVIPARYPDVSAAASVRAILAVSSTSWTVATAPTQALAGLRGTTITSLGPAATGNGSGGSGGSGRPGGSGAAGQSPPQLLPSATLDAGQRATSVAGGLRAAIAAVPGGDPGAVLAAVPGRIQRAAGTAFRYDNGPGGIFAADLAAVSTALAGAVSIAAQPGDRYSLASSDSPLLLVIVNNLPQAVRIRVRVVPRGNVLGFRSGSDGTVLVPAGSRPTLRIPTSVSRTGRFDVTAVVESPDGTTLGTPVTLSVRNTAVGAVGSVITIGAGVLLVLALLLRGVRRWRRRDRAGSADNPANPRDERSESAPAVGTHP